MPEFKVSVITAVYNVAPYIRQSVESALVQPETAEILLVEDGSTDNSLDICRALVNEYPKVRLLQHPDRGNHGYPAALNMGIRSSRCEFIAFLDADDFYFPNRFAVTKAVFEQDQSIEGVYEAVAFHFDDEAARRRWLQAGQSSGKMLTISECVPPEEFFYRYMENKIGFFSKNGLVLRRHVFSKTGFYDEHLLLHQDSAMNIKLAAVARLAPGRIDEPVAVQRVHWGNRIAEPRPVRHVYKTKMLCWDTAWAWSRQHLDPDKEQIVLDFLLRQIVDTPRFAVRMPRGLQKRLQLLLHGLKNRALLREPLYWRYLRPERLAARIGWR